ncbi:MAG: UDP-2,3-diacylglucosamine diphosphatase LpxI [Rhodospirillum sp.]|nr:UDP-2,3-diacylglucosamine diphosphatase LpxI [Rhodospirillum sp.]MCF8488448.1 UDP-2,3-diacylglucosamine diphosphatase LpxI [Rhodospirillum sp.]MCF8499110.1 UDP-2,3-diacylglucosamine diphosphatase LpxI [Rhodospirillum sp.]
MEIFTNDKHPATVPERVPLVLVAGGGSLPLKVYEACRRRGRPVLLVGLTGHADPKDWPADLEQVWIRLGKSGGTGAALLERGFRHICLAGHVRRPSLGSLWPDLKTAQFLTKVGAAALGDDGLLKAVLTECERMGAVVEAPDQVIGDDPAPVGVRGAHEPDETAWIDLRHAFAVAKALGSLDVGQGCVCQQGMVLALEAIEGTDAMVTRAGELRRDGRGGVLVKVAKPEQDRRVDLPTIGPRTVINAHAAGLRGIGYEAGATILLDVDEVIVRADRLGLFLVGLTPEEGA